MNAHELGIALAGYPCHLEVRDDTGAPRTYTGVSRRIGEDGHEYLVLLSEPRRQPEKAPEPEPNPYPGKLPYYPPGVR